ncbi:MAG: DUF4272 domain-containing protein [Actinomycetota bacterium]|nr:DUF4272 domain-containing protein [Actinomycetota bacterium]
MSDRTLVLYALIRRASIEAVLEEGPEPRRLAQAERAKVETVGWLRRESLDGALTPIERTLFDGASGSWPHEAIADGLWRKESLGVLSWALGHVAALPPIDEEFEVEVLNHRIQSYGNESSFRASGRLRDDAELEAAWHEADAWLAATEGRAGEDVTLASISAERRHALSWLRDRDAEPA